MSCSQFLIGKSFTYGQHGDKCSSLWKSTKQPLFPRQMTCENSVIQGPQSNFDNGGGGGGTISGSILEGTKHFFLLILYNFKNIGVGAHAPPPYSAPPAIINEPLTVTRPRLTNVLLWWKTLYSRHLYTRNEASVSTYVEFINLLLNIT